MIAHLKGVLAGTGADHAVVEGGSDKIRFDVFLGERSVASEVVSVDGDTSATFHIGNPSLWYPIRYGKQPLSAGTRTSGHQCQLTVRK